MSTFIHSFGDNTEAVAAMFHFSKSVESFVEKSIFSKETIPKDFNLHQAEPLREATREGVVTVWLSFYG